MFLFNGEIRDEWKIGDGARYFNDVIERTLEVKAGCYLDATSYSVIANADVIALLGPSETRLQLLIGNMSESLTQIKLCIN